MITRYLHKRRPVRVNSQLTQQSESLLESQSQSSLPSFDADIQSTIAVHPSVSFNSDASPAPSTPSGRDARPGVESSTPSSCSKQCRFDIRLHQIWLGTVEMKNVRYRPAHVKSLGRSGSWVWQNGAGLECEQHKRLFVCKSCHLAGKYRSDDYIASSTDSAWHHLAIVHQIQAADEAKKTTVPSTYCDKCGNSGDQAIDALVFRQLYVDWMINHNLSFEVALGPDTLALFGTSGHRHSLPTSSTTISSYVMDSYRARAATVMEAILSARNKMNILRWMASTRFTDGVRY